MMLYQCPSSSENSILRVNPGENVGHGTPCPYTTTRHFHPLGARNT